MAHNKVWSITTGVGVKVGGRGVNVEGKVGGGSVKVAVGKMGVGGGGGVPHKAG